MESKFNFKVKMSKHSLVKALIYISFQQREFECCPFYSSKRQFDFCFLLTIQVAALAQSTEISRRFILVTIFFC